MGAFHCSTTLASVVGTVTVTIHYKQTSHRHNSVTSGCHNIFLIHSLWNTVKNTDKNKKKKKAPTATTDVSWTENTQHATQQLEFTQSYRACKYNTALHGTHTHTHAAWSVYEMASQVLTSPLMTHPAWRQQPIVASAGESTKLIGQRNEEIICSLPKSSNVQNQNNHLLCVWFGILNKLFGIGQNQSYLYQVENYLKMKTGFRWMEMYLDPHLLVFLSRLSDISCLKEQVWNSGHFGMTEA